MIRQQHFMSEFDARLQPHVEFTDYVFVGDGADMRSSVISVEPWNGGSWTAAFRSEEPGLRALTGLVGTPSPSGLCVVERGTPFLGDVLDPGRFRAIEVAGPVVAVEELRDEGVLLLLSPWTISAVHSEGVYWTTKRISIESLRVDEVIDGWVCGVADEGEEMRNFAVNLTTGEVMGGSGFE